MIRAAIITLILSVCVVLIPVGGAQAAGGCSQYNGLLAANHMPVTFSHIMWRESRCNPRAVNRRSGTLGLLQLMPQHVGSWHTCPGMTRASLLTAQGNIACAAKIYHRSGWRPWAL